MLPDCTFMLAGMDEGPYDGEQPSLAFQPLVLHLDADAEVLASDRGLWFGDATPVAADEDGSVYVVGMIRDVEPALPTLGVYVRKYLP